MRNLTLTLFLSFFLLLSYSSFAQVPTSMDYQIMATNPNTGQVLANKEMKVKVELRLGSEEGNAVWSKEETLKSSKSGVCTISLDFKDVDWSQGNYFIKAFIDDKPVGASQIKSVPFALYADGVSGVITKKQLIGTWKWTGNLSDDPEDDRIDDYTAIFNEDGSFSWVYKYYNDEYSSVHGEFYGTWTINNLGYITFNVSSGTYTRPGSKYVCYSVYDNETKSLYLGTTNGYKRFNIDGFFLVKQE